MTNVVDIKEGDRLTLPDKDVLTVTVLPIVAEGSTAIYGTNATGVETSLWVTADTDIEVLE